MNKTKLQRNSLCPCGSGKKYKKCCINKEFSWMTDDKGNISRAIRINNELMSLLEVQLQRFKETFDREPGPDDPVFFEQFYMHETPQYLDDMMLEIMDKVNIDEAYKYAYKKTGRIVTEINQNFISDIEIKEWMEAVNEYYTLQDSEDKLDDSNTVVDNLICEFEPCVLNLGMIVKRGGSFDEGYEREFTKKEYILFCVTKTFKTMKSILDHIKVGNIEDSFVLLRTVYENFINILYISRNPLALENLIAIQIGIKSGTHEYGRNKKGQVDKRLIIERITGKEYLGHISNYTMISSSVYELDINIFDKLYELLSSFTHPINARLNMYKNA